MYQLETGASGTPHWQGYIELNKAVRLTSMRDWLPGAHFEQRRGTREEARSYCMKEEGRQAGPFERGDWQAGGQGRRSDLSAAVAVVQQFSPTTAMRTLARTQGEAYVRHHSGLRALAAELQELPGDEGFVPRPWQTVVLDRLSQPADDRTIFWVTDTRGGHGKSRLARHLVLQHGAIQLSGRLLDMQYLYNKQKIVVFDVSRAAAEYSDHLYSMAEALKNGMFTSTKYVPQLKVFDPPQVIFFSNQSWDRTKFSLDRVVEWDLNNPDLHRTV